MGVRRPGIIAAVPDETIHPTPAEGEAFDAVVDKGRAALLAGELHTEAAPVDGQARWGLAMPRRSVPPGGRRTARAWPGRLRDVAARPRGGGSLVRQHR